MVRHYLGGFYVIYKTKGLCVESQAKQGSVFYWASLLSEEASDSDRLQNVRVYVM